MKNLLSNINSSNFHILSLLNQTRAHISAMERNYLMRPVLRVPESLPELLKCIAAIDINTEFDCGRVVYYASFSSYATAEGAAQAWLQTALHGDPESEVDEHIVCIPYELLDFVCPLYINDPRQQEVVERSHKAFLDASTELTDEASRAKLRTYAAGVMLIFDTNRIIAGGSVRKQIIRISDIVFLIERQASTQNCAPEFFDLDYAHRIMELSRMLGEVERAALAVYTGIVACDGCNTPQPSQIFKDCGPCSACSENTCNLCCDGKGYCTDINCVDILGRPYDVDERSDEIVCEPEDDHEPDLYTSPDHIKDGHYIWCNQEPRIQGELTFTCVQCTDFWDSYKVSGPAATVEEHVAKFMREYGNPGYWGREEGRSQPTPETLEVTLGRRAVCD